ncbi:hypothetical protein Tco_0946352 [Tanacetum coccineum]
MLQKKRENGLWNSWRREGSSLQEKGEIEKRNKPPTKAQQRSLMCTYLKNMDGWKPKNLKNKSRKIQAEVTEGSSKRTGDDLASDVSKKQKVDEQVEAEEDDDLKEEETRRHMEIVVDKEEIAIEAIPLATKLPLIVEYKIVREGIMGHFQLIRANGSSKRYSSMIKLLHNINREDLETLWKLVKAKHGNTRPGDDHERVLWGDLKVMFEPDIKSEIWRSLQGYKVTIWKLFDSFSAANLELQLLSNYNCWKDYVDRDEIKDISEKR